MEQKSSSPFLTKRKERESLALRTNLLKRKQQQIARRLLSSSHSSSLSQK